MYLQKQAAGQIHPHLWDRLLSGQHLWLPRHTLVYQLSHVECECDLPWPRFWMIDGVVQTWRNYFPRKPTAENLKASFRMKLTVIWKVLSAISCFHCVFPRMTMPAISCLANVEEVQCWAVLAASRGFGENPFRREGSTWSQHRRFPEIADEPLRDAKSWLCWPHEIVYF